MTPALGPPALATGGAPHASFADHLRPGRAHIPALTGLRGYAACWVMLFHGWFIAWSAQPGLPPREAVPLVGRGYLGVDLFFVLSGYVLMMTHGAALARWDRTALRTFARGRLFRILPLHWLVLLALLLLQPFMASRWISVEPTGPGLFMQTAFLVQSWTGHPMSWNTPTWSLSAEWAVYFAFPLLVRGMAPLGARGCIAVIGVGAVLIQAGAQASGGDGLDHVYALGLIRCFCEVPMGMAAYRLSVVESLPRGRDADPLLLGGLVLFAVGMLMPRWEALVPIAFLFVVLGADAGSPLADRMFGNRPAHFLGEISFSIYLLHIPVLNLVWQAAAPWVGASPALVLVTLGGGCLLVIPLAWATWRRVEVPAQARGRRTRHGPAQPVG